MNNKRIKTYSISRVLLLTMALLSLSVFAPPLPKPNTKAPAVVSKKTAKKPKHKPAPVPAQATKPAPEPKAAPTPAPAPKPAPAPAPAPAAQNRAIEAHPGEAPLAKPAPNAPKARWHQSNLESHWAKHGAEFPEFHSAKEYGDAALVFFSNPPEGTLIKTRENGEKLFYHPPTNTFGAAAPDGTPKTLFRPTGRMNYWNRQ